MTTLAMMAVGIGAAAVLGKAPGVIAPDRTRDFVKDFPRNRFWGWALAALDLVLAAVLVWEMPLGWFDAWKMSLVIVCPVALALVGIFLNELLAARALGGLLLIAAAPVLEEARFHPSGARLVMSVLAYAWVIPGMVIVANPWWFRKLSAPLMATNRRCRLASAAGVLLGLALIGLGLWVY